MLFLPYRNEENDILRKDFRQLYDKNVHMIAENRRKFNKYENEIDELDEIAFQNESENLNELDPKFKVYAVQNIDHDLSLDFPELINEPINNIRKETVLLDEADYVQLIRSLNQKQREYLAHVLDNIHYDRLFYDFVSGEFLFC